MFLFFHNENNSETQMKRREKKKLNWFIQTAKTPYQITKLLRLLYDSATFCVSFFFHTNFQIDGVKDTKYTRLQVRQQVIRLVKSLSNVFGVKEGDVIGLCSENRLEFPVVVFAAFCLGVTIAPLNVTYTDRK